MPKTALLSAQLHLFPGDTPTSLDALARYETLRPILQGQRTLLQQSHITGLPYKRLWRDLQRFRRDGLYGLLDHRTLPHRRGKTPIEAQVPVHIQQQIVRSIFGTLKRGKGQRDIWAQGYQGIVCMGGLGVMGEE